MKSAKPTAVVIGGGLTGLLSALRLAEAGRRVRVLEASAEFGGFIGQIELGGLHFDSGAESFAINRPETIELIKELGLTDFLAEPRRSDARIISQGRSYPIPAGIMGIPADLKEPAVLAIVGQSALDLAEINDRAPWNVPHGATLAELVATRLGPRFVRDLVDPIVAGVHASDAQNLEVESILPGLMQIAAKENSLIAAVRILRAGSGRPGAAVMGLVGGDYRLIVALVARLERLGVELSRNTPVTAISRDGQKWLVKAVGAAIASDELVMAVPAHIAAALLAFAPDLSAKLAQVKTVDVALAMMLVDAPELNQDPTGSGALIEDAGTGVAAKATTHASAKWEWIRASLPAGRHLIRFSYGRNGQLPPDLQRLFENAEADLERFYRIDRSKIVDLKIIPWRQSLVQARPGHAANIANIAALAQALPAFALVGAAIGGNGITGNIRKCYEAIAQLKERQGQ